MRHDKAILFTITRSILKFKYIWSVVLLEMTKQISLTAKQKIIFLIVRQIFNCAEIVQNNMNNMRNTLKLTLKIYKIQLSQFNTKYKVLTKN